MKKILLTLLMAQAALLAACSSFDGGRYPPPQHLPTKADRFTCSNSQCDVIPITISVDVNRRCTAKFNYQAVVVEGGAVSRFALFKLQTDVQFRFTSSPPGIAIDFGGDAPVFRTGGEFRNGMIAQVAGEARSVSDGTVFLVEALTDIPPNQRAKPYPFRINTEWFDGTRWAPCAEIDPVIANN